MVKNVPRLPPDTICYCFEVTERTLRQIIQTHSVQTIDELEPHTFAGLGCRSCRWELEELIAKVLDE